jgi:transcription-repair coupling factor (superfamily II helicase)
MKVENLLTRLENILDRELSLGHKNMLISGASGLTPIALVLSQSFSKNISHLPHLVIFSRSQDVLKFQQMISFFDPSRSCHILPEYDVSPYSGLDPNPKFQAKRIAFLYRAQAARPGEIFATTVSALMQKTIPFDVLTKSSKVFRKDDVIDESFSDYLGELGYQSSPYVEDVGHFATRGGIIDLFTPFHPHPVRISLFGDQVESLRYFSIVDQCSLQEIDSLHILPCRETIWDEDRLEKLILKFRQSVGERDVDKSEYEETLRSITRKTSFQGQEFCLPMFYDQLSGPLDHFCDDLTVWFSDPLEIFRQSDQIISDLKTEFQDSAKNLILPEVENLYKKFEELQFSSSTRRIFVSPIDTFDSSSSKSEQQQRYKVSYSTFSILELSNSLGSQTVGSENWLKTLHHKISSWIEEGYHVFIGTKGRSQIERLRLFFEKINLKYNLALPEEHLWGEWSSKAGLTILSHPCSESIRLTEERLVFIKDEDLLGKKSKVKSSTASEDFHKQAKRLSFGDLKPGDLVVHVQHGIGIYEGLKIMQIGGVDSEFIQVAYKDKDKLYLPVYRVGQLQKYSGNSGLTVLDKLGGQAWEKTKSKVKSHVRDLASDLLQVYAKRAELNRPAFQFSQEQYTSFELGFPYDETEDQLTAISYIQKDLTSTKPMDRLICGDVGFGKTEVAMRATFVAAAAKKQVAVLAPTTVLTFQHFENFKARFKSWPFVIRELNRFVSPADVKKTLLELKEGKVDIIIGTHRLLSKDVEFKDLGLLIIDEEQKFGVAHKEKIRKIKSGVDTLAMSATPIPRTLNMSLVGIRDLSLINTAPVDRLPTRTFVCKWDDDSIRKAIDSEISRGGQVFFIHNRVQSIYSIADQVRNICPNARIAIGHGQMDEEQLEKVMIGFFNHEIDVLVCTTIVESGMDIPKANTMFIDQAHMMGLSQLYQLRGRVGRSKLRAYCYLIVPKDKKLDKDAQERLKVLQENTALGSGIKIAQYDLELRGAGNLLGEEQSGHINSVGYELFMDLLNEAIHELKGEPAEDYNLEPEINLRIPALIPEKYISDIRIRLSYYKALADINSPEELDKIENELKDQFGEIPEATLNLMGLMLIRSECRKLGVKDIGAGLKNVSLLFSEKTKMRPETVIKLAMRENKKYSITPDNRLNIRMNNISWPSVYEELQYLLKLADV